MANEIGGIVSVAIALGWGTLVTAWAQAPSEPAARIGILGDPVHRVAWSDKALEALKAIGFNEVQLNIAWGSRPFGEALNLVDVVTWPGEADLPGTPECRAE